MICESLLSQSDLTAHVGRPPAFPKPTAPGRWLYVEVDSELIWITHKEVATYRGWVNALGFGSCRFEDWLSHELLLKLQGAARRQRGIQRRTGVSVDETSHWLEPLASVALVAAMRT